MAIFVTLLILLFATLGFAPIIIASADPNEHLVLPKRYQETHRR